MAMQKHHQSCLYARNTHRLWTTMTVGLVLLSYKAHGQQQTNSGNEPEVMANDGLSDVIIVIIVAACIGVLLAVVLGLICYFHYKRTHLGEMTLETETLPSQLKNNAMTHPNVQVTSIEMTDKANTTKHQIYEETDQKPSPIVLNKWKDFKTLLEELRPQAETILVMLNDVRQRLREAKHGNPRIEGYKAVIRDLARVLFILNKKEEKIKMPPDGVELLTWAQQIVNKYMDCQKIKEERKSNNKSYSTPPEMSAVLWIQSKDDSAFEEGDHHESHVI